MGEHKALWANSVRSRGRALGGRGRWLEGPVRDGVTGPARRMRSPWVVLATWSESVAWGGQGGAIGRHGDWGEGCWRSPRDGAGRAQEAREGWWGATGGHLVEGSRSQAAMQRGRRHGEGPGEGRQARGGGAVEESAMAGTGHKHTREAGVGVAIGGGGGHLHNERSAAARGVRAGQGGGGGGAQGGPPGQEQ